MDGRTLLTTAAAATLPAVYPSAPAWAEAMAALYDKWAARAQVEPSQKVVSAPRQNRASI